MKAQRKRVAEPQRTSDAEEIEKRRERGLAGDFVIENLDPAQPVFSNFRVRSPSGQSYEVELRDLAWREVYCTCVDFRVNRLGTCKHAEAVLAELEAQRPQDVERAFEEGSPRIDVVPAADGASLAVARNFEALPAEWQARFTEAGLPAGEQVEDLLTRLAAVDGVRISREVREWVAERRREADLFEARREYEQAVRSGHAPLSETAVPLAPYQREGMLHLAFRERAILADEIGLGRSAQAIAACALLERLGRARRVLAVVPHALRPAWEAEIAQLTSLSCRPVARSGPSRLQQYEEPAFFTLCTYEQASRDVGPLNEVLAPDVVILDEAQRIRDWDAPVALKIKQLRSRYAFVLTSDAIGQDVDEVYALMSFVNPEVLGPLFRFNREYYRFDEAGQPVGTQNLDALRQRIRPYVMRRARTDVAAQLPPLSEAVYTVELEGSQQAAYREQEQIAEDLRREEAKRSLTRPERDRLIRCLSTMRMICDSPAVLGARQDAPAPKIVELLRILEETDTGRVVVFSEWERMARLVFQAIQSTGREAVLVHGELGAAERRSAAERFAGDSGCRFAVSTDLGSSPLAAAGAQTLIHVDVPWNLRRIELRRRSLAVGGHGLLREIYLVARGTLEERLLARHRRRRPSPRAAAGETGDPGEPEEPPVGEMLPPQETPPRLLSPEETRQLEAHLDHAARRLRVARAMIGEGFAEDAVEQLRAAFLGIARARALREGVAPPDVPDALLQAPLAESIGAESLALWKWFQDPKSLAASGAAIAARLISEQPSR